MPEFQEKTSVVAIDQLDRLIYRITLRAPLVASAAHPGQFVMVRVSNQFDPLLRRPFSIHQVAGANTVQLLYKVVGQGTALMSRLVKGDLVDIIGPLGRGFALRRRGRICLVGGGMGIAPLLFLGRRLLMLGRHPDDDMVLLGARTGAELAVLADDFADLGYPLRIATDDGSLGHQGLVPELLEEILPYTDMVYVCGPVAMMQCVVMQCRKAGVTCQVSLETHMACGLGACLGCAVQGSDGGFVHVCQDGPVFMAGEIAWNR